MSARSLLGQIRDEFIHVAQVQQALHQCDELESAYEDAGEDSSERREICAQIAERLEGIAEHLDTSKVARCASRLNTAYLRREAAQWRAGTMRVGR